MIDSATKCSRQDLDVYCVMTSLLSAESGQLLLQKLVGPSGSPEEATFRGDLQTYLASHTQQVT